MITRLLVGESNAFRFPYHCSRTCLSSSTRQLPMSIVLSSSTVTTSTSNIYRNCLVRMFHACSTHEWTTYINIFFSHPKTCLHLLHAHGHFFLFFQLASCITPYPMEMLGRQTNTLVALLSSHPGIQATWISTSWRGRRAFHAAKYVRLPLAYLNHTTSWSMSSNKIRTKMLSNSCPIDNRLPITVASQSFCLNLHR
jgi:hypothetical protein